MSDPDTTLNDDVDPGPSPAMPRWVKASLWILAGLLAVLVLGKVTGLGGSHGPGMHTIAPHAVSHA